VHLDIIKVIYSPTNAQVIFLKTILASTDNELPEDGGSEPKYVGAISL
jgi:hypothetical protein